MQATQTIQAESLSDAARGGQDGRGSIAPIAPALSVRAPALGAQLPIHAQRSRRNYQARVLFLWAVGGRRSRFEMTTQTQSQDNVILALKRPRLAAQK